MQNISASRAREPLPHFRRVVLGARGRVGVRLAVVVHVYYDDLATELELRLRSISEPFDLFVTTPFEAYLPGIFERFSTISASITVHVSENRGRDIGPFIALLRTGLLSSYLAVLKLHSKKSTYSEHGTQWRRRIFDGLLTDLATVREVVRLFETQPIGMIGPDEYYLSNPHFWGANRTRVQQLLEAMGLAREQLQPKLGFFAGSMFWFNPVAFRSLVEVDEAVLSFERENGAQDGTLAHAIERIFCTVSRSQGLRNTSVRLGGRELDETDTSHNRVPVL